MAPRPTLTAAIGFALLAAPAAAADLPRLKGEFYPIEPKLAAPIYEVSAVMDDKVLDPEIIYIRTADGEPRTKEILRRGPDGAFQSYSFVRYNIGQYGEIERRGEELVFRLFENGAFADETVTALPSDFCTGPMVTSFVVANREQLGRGETVKLSYGVADRQRLVDFKLQKVEERSSAERTVIEMKPDSWLIRLIVDPVYFIFDDGQSVPTRIVGRILPMEVIDGDPEPVDANLVFTNAPQISQLKAALSPPSSPAGK